MDNQKLENIRHSCAHLLAAAVKSLYRGAHNAIGPSIENGFYQDFDMGEYKISEADLPKIEEKMREILKGWGPFIVREVSIAQAKKDFAANPYKLELIEEFSAQGKTITENDPGNFLDLCRGGHSENPPEEIKHFKLLSVAGAYWRGSEKNKMLTRIYGTCFATKAELEAYLHLQEEAAKRDHRKLGADLDLFVFSDLVGKGLPLLTPNGAIIRRELEKFVLDEEIRRGYKHVLTPSLAKVKLFETSGHYPYYKDTMYPVMQVDEDQLILRPMTCPHHFALYNSRPRSYRELPLRLAEFADLFRYEKSGELSGLMRVRMFCLADAHIVAAPEQAKSEIKNVLDLIDYINGVLGMKKGVDYRYQLSLGDRSDENKKYYKDDASWDKAENVLRAVLQELDAPYFEAPNEAAFYGPKIDIQVKKVNGHEETAFTVQYDFVMPKRFDLKYVDKDGQEKQPIVIHRSSIGCFERTMSFLIEHYAGAFPVWLSPVQILFAPVGENHVEGAQKLADEFKNAGVRVEIDDADETLGNKVRKAAQRKIPYIIVVGDKELEGGDLMVRVRGEEKPSKFSKAEFLAKVLGEIKERV